MRLISWNVNGLRAAAQKGFMNWFETQEADVVCLQETKLEDAKFPVEEIRAAGLYDAGTDPGVEANSAKMLAADASWEAAEACLQTHGGFGFAEEYDVERKFREARLYQVAPISTNLILCFIAERVLGLPKSY